MKWFQRGFTFFIIGVVAYVVYELAVQHNEVDPALIALVSLVFNVCVYFIGRSDKYEEQVLSERGNHARVLHSGDSLDTEPSDYGAVLGPGDEEHPNLPQSPG